jgi:hypothetical protein
MKQILIPVAFSVLCVAGYAEKRPDMIVTRDGREIVSADYQDAVEYLPQKLPTFGKQTVVIQIEIPVKVEPKWRRYYIANFVQKYAAVLNKKIGVQMEFAAMSDTPDEKLADKWEAQEIVVPAEFEELPQEAEPQAGELVHNQRIVSWEYRATALAEKDFKALKAKIGSAE